MTFTTTVPFHHNPLSSVFAQKYAPRYSQNDSELFSYLAAISKQKWVYNSSNAKEFRVDLRAALGKEGRFENFIATRQNTRLDQNISFYLRGSMLMSKTLWRSLPRDTIYKRRRHRTCSVVGSSGVLNGSRCGNLIDKANFVLRFNLAYVKGYEADVGIKTHFTTLNPSLVYKRFNRLRTKQNYADFEEVLKQFKGSQLWLPAFASTLHHRTLLRVASAARYSKLVTPILGHPDHYTTVAKLWKKTLNVTGWTTTGLHVFTSIFDLCDRIDVFGFWPFAESLEGKTLPYHYHDGRRGSSAHSFTKEFKAILHLHELGIINLHLGSCL
ncbi:alpha-2,8-sialyltransferase 8E-like [Patiria miniata]|uniref:Uncharacterized protein n=1 Tax=Patiria miniata TaxID=46514 RepID=A0A913ZP20_PATMI|nr:alpha-2,8-sialyltransferase 8E-like [Patiria miniata]